MITEKQLERAHTEKLAAYSRENEDPDVPEPCCGDCSDCEDPCEDCCDPDAEWEARRDAYE